MQKSSTNSPNLNNDGPTGLVYHVLEGYIYCEEGVRIGGIRETGEIGGSDNPVIRHPITKMPYIPGSSLKGRMRSLLEQAYRKTIIKVLEDEIKKLKDKMNKVESQDKKGKLERKLKILKKRKDDFEKGAPCHCGLPKCPICRLFGPHKNTEHELGPSRLVFHDATIVKTREELKGKDLKDKQPLITQERLKELWKQEGTKFVEVKPENIVGRINPTARDYRQMERIPAGTVLHFKLVVQEFLEDRNNNALEEWKKIIKEGLKLLQEGKIGGSKTRGYGKIEFIDLRFDGDAFSLDDQKQETNRS